MIYMTLKCSKCSRVFDTVQNGREAVFLLRAKAEKAGWKNTKGSNTDLCPKCLPPTKKEQA